MVHSFVLASESLCNSLQGFGCLIHGGWFPVSVCPQVSRPGDCSERILRPRGDQILNMGPLTSSRCLHSGWKGWSSRGIPSTLAVEATGIQGNSFLFMPRGCRWGSSLKCSQSLPGPSGQLCWSLQGADDWLRRSSSLSLHLDGVIQVEDGIEPFFENVGTLLREQVDYSPPCWCRVVIGQSWEILGCRSPEVEPSRWWVSIRRHHFG